MNNFNHKGFLSAAVTALLALTVCCSLFGCGDDNAIKKDDPATAAKAMDTAKLYREMYDKSNGNYESLTDGDKAKLNAATGSEANSKLAFSHMSPASVPPKP